MSFLEDKKRIERKMLHNPKLFKIINRNFTIEEYENIMSYLRDGVSIFPRSNMFKAFQIVDENNLKVVILGQDPYYTKGFCKLSKTLIPYATGVAFGVPNTMAKIPPSLKNIIKEASVNPKNIDYSLESWAEQGVLLLNTALTVEENNPGSHAKEWEEFTKYVISDLCKEFDGLIFVLWGNHAKNYKQYINLKNSYVLEAAHPSPLSAHKGFFGCGHFVKINKILYKLNKNQIVW